MTYKDAIRFFHRYGGLEGSFSFGDLYNTKPSRQDLMDAMWYSIQCKGKSVERATLAGATVRDYWELMNTPSMADLIVTMENGNELPG